MLRGDCFIPCSHAITEAAPAASYMHHQRKKFCCFRGCQIWRNGRWFTASFSLSDMVKTDIHTLTPFSRRHFQMHFFNENVWISIKISLKFVPKVQINNIPALVQIMAWCRPGDKPLSEPMMVRLRPNQSGNWHKTGWLAQTRNSTGHLKGVHPPTITLAYLMPENICQCDHRWISFFLIISDACRSLVCLMN